MMDYYYGHCKFKKRGGELNLHQKLRNVDQSLKVQKLKIFDFWNLEMSKFFYKISGINQEISGAFSIYSCANIVDFSGNVL